MTLLIISACLFALATTMCFVGLFMDWDKEIFSFFVVLLIGSGLSLVISAGFVSKKVKPIEYPVSEYDFKIKVVEFEEHRDTILVVTPKDKIK